MHHDILQTREVTKIHHEFHQDCTESISIESMEKVMTVVMVLVRPFAEISGPKLFQVAASYALFIGKGDWISDRSRAVVTGLVTAIVYLDLNGFHVKANNPKLLSLIESSGMNSTIFGKALFNQFRWEQVEENNLTSQADPINNLTCGCGQQNLKPRS